MKIVITTTIIMLLAGCSWIMEPTPKIDLEKAKAVQARAEALYAKAEHYYQTAKALVTETAEIVGRFVDEMRAPTVVEATRLREIAAAKDDLVVGVKQLLLDARQLYEDAKDIVTWDNEKYTRLIAILDAVIALLL